jgi:transcriptional regulator with XRE-family HTH domain
MDVRRLVGANLKDLRKRKGVSQEALAFDCDLHRTYISGVERGIRNPTVVVLAKIAKALSVDSSVQSIGQGLIALYACNQRGDSGRPAHDRSVSDGPAFPNFPPDA